VTPSEQEGLGVLRLLELESVSLGTGVEVHGLAPVLERDVRGARRLHDPSSHVLAPGDPSHLFLLLFL
jgi:hypothetical protein